MVKNLPAMQETQVWSLGLGRSPGEGNGYPLQYPCLENSMDGGAWRATIHGVARSWTQLSNTNTFLVAYWTPSDEGGSSFCVVSFCIFILFMEFSQQEYWSGLPFPPPVDHVLSELFTIICFGWPCTAWFIASLSYASPLAMTRQWFMKGI